MKQKEIKHWEGNQTENKKQIALVPNWQHNALITCFMVVQNIYLVSTTSDNICQNS